MAMPVKVTNMKVAAKLLNGARPGAVILSSQSNDHGDSEYATTVRKLDTGEIMIQTHGSKARAGHIYLDADLRELVGDFSGGRSNMRATFKVRHLEDALTIMNKRLRTSFYVPHEMRDPIDHYSREVMAEADANAAAPTLKAA